MSPGVIIAAAVVGLFAGAAVWNVARNQAGKRPLFGPLSCDPGDGVLPAMSWLPLHGFGMARTCRGDGTPQSSRRLAFELATALYFAVAAWRIDDWVDLIPVGAFAVPLLVILLVDAWTRLIYTNVVGLGVLLGLGAAAVDDLSAQLWRSAAGLAVGAAVFTFFFVLAMVIYRNPKVVPFGQGDVYLAGMIGAMVRVDGVARALLYGIFLAGITVGLLLITRRVNRKQAVPYGPFLVLGALLALVWS